MNTLITAQDALNELCVTLGAQAIITIDTEFIREKTYYPQLCLIQVAWDGGAMAIDPLVGLDLSPLLAILANPAIIKIFHAARQDLEIFYKLMGGLPQNVTDTQIMALALGYTDQIAYDRLMNAELGVNLSKGQRYTDWAKRPLTDKQIDYALADVTHLLDAYHKMRARLELKNRQQWYQANLANLVDEETYRADPERAHERLKLRSSDGRVLARAQKLAAWRERKAQQEDLPRNWILKDEVLTELALSGPGDAAAISNIRGIGKNITKGDDGRAILQLIQEANDAPLSRGMDAKPDNSPPAAVMELLRVLLQSVAEQEKINPKLIASQEDLVRLAKAKDGEIVLSEWRADLFGQHAAALKRGEIALGLERNRLKIIRLDKTE